ncbi:autotransporter outer membrane beta-barrel domain-containing protein [Haemophilus haemolyticus]|uniref:Autotransporter outer membrane beta-barrel domain-containing protein n=2 Tax=Haemophilus haemolyticus TaxID=726 RepID=A0A852Q0Y4_HAEHA|nr:autotransporter outer membrane beta-barrel domain-containing protein [Haemophilus haemolyticus]
MIIRSDRTEEIQGKTNIAVTLASEQNMTTSPDSNAAYGIAVGYDWKGEGTNKTVLTLKDDTKIDVNNTPNTVLGSYSKPGATAPIGHQLTGIRVYRSGNQKSTPIFNSEKQLTINVEDKTTARIGDYLTGIYVAGDDAEVNLKDTNITISANGKFSSALKIGKPNSNNGATINSTGKMVLDTENTEDSATVRLFDNKSRFIADSETATTEIKSANSAVVFDTVDFETEGTVNLNQLGKTAKVDLFSIIKNPLISNIVKGSLTAEESKDFDELSKNAVHTEKFVRGTSNNDNEVILNNAQLTTKSKTDALILANARYKEGGDIYKGGKLVEKLAPLTTNFLVRAILPGANKLANDALASLRELQSYFNTGNFNVTNAKFTLKGNKSTATSAPKGWAVYAKSEEIDETNKTAKAHSELTATFSDGAKLTGLVHQDIGSTLTMNVDNKAVWFLNKKEDETEQRSTAKSVTLSNGGILDAGTNPVDKYIVKVSSNGVDKDGTFTNGGIITLANQSYADKLTIEGNYVGKNGVLEVNTKWNTPGNYLGANSESDLLTITGDASGNTTVKAVKTDGTENVIDGSIGELADRYKRSVPVIKVLGDDKGTANGEINSTDATKPYAYNTRSTFTGTAKTTGAGELQLVSRKDEAGATEYFWTLTTPNKDKTIITPSAPAYTLVPRQNLESGYAMLDTLHQRRGENQTLSWDKQGGYWQDVEKQSWGRVIGKHLKLDGKERFGFKTNMYGFQVGHDFDVKTKQDDEGKLTRRFTGLYFGALRSHSKFYDEYRAKNGVVIADKLTSRVKTTALNLGVTDTRYNENGTYIDWVGQLSWLNNRYSSVDGTQAKNHGWGAALSVETGRPYALGKDKTNNGDSWILEPQAQLIAQYLRLGNFNDGTRAVSQKGYGLRGRVGFRLAYNKPNDKQRTRTYYFIGNIWHDFKATGNALIGRDKLTEKFDRTWWELGLGSQFSLSENTYLYADARYEKSFNNNSHKGYQGTVGVKYSWK